MFARATLFYRFEGTEAWGCPGRTCVLCSEPQSLVLRRNDCRPVMGQASNDWIHQSHHIVPVHANQFTMRARGEGDLLVFGQAAVDIHRHVVEIPKWRHRARLAIRESI